jgi:hypothetical protein
VHGEVAARPACCGGRVSGSGVSADVLSTLGAGGAQTVTPAGSSRALLPPYVESRFITIAGDTRRALYMHPPSSVALELDVPANAFFQTAIGIDPPAWTQPTGDGVRFIASVESQGRREVVLDRILDPRSRDGDRRWIDVWADLTPYAGRHVRLTLATDARADASFDWAAWAHPQVVVWHAARPSPAEPHPW